MKRDGCPLHCDRDRDRGATRPRSLVGRRPRPRARHAQGTWGCRGSATNPEQLFAAGYAACFENALLRVARERKAPIRESSVTSHVGIGREESGFFRLTVKLEVSVPGRDRADVEEMVRVAHEEVCPYSRATRGNIEVEAKVV